MTREESKKHSLLRIKSVALKKMKMMKMGIYPTDRSNTKIIQSGGH